MFGQKLLTAAAVGLVATFASAPIDAASIGWNYQGVGGVGLNPSDTAGAPGFAQDNWNNHLGSGQGPGSVPFDLNNDSGVDSGVDVVAWSNSAANSWQNQDTSSNDAILLNDFNNNDAVITFGGVNSFTADGYTVVVYYSNNEAVTGSTLDVNGDSTTINTFTSGPNGTGDTFSVTGWVQNTGDGVTESNYAVFTGVSGDTLTVSIDAPGNDGVSAIQIIEVPEPGSLALLGLGGLMIARRRRG